MLTINILEKIKTGILYFDGAMGSLLQKDVLKAGEFAENLNLSAPDIIKDIHLKYLQAGADVITANTFGANSLKFDNCEEIIKAAVTLAKEAISDFGKDDKYVAMDIGPTGKLLKPLGDLDFEDAINVFKKSIAAGASAGADLILIETLNDSYETKAAVIAAKESCSLPIFVCNVYDESHKLMTGADPLAMVSMLEGLGVDVIGMNCSLGPKQMNQIIPKLYENCQTPIMVSPNAGLPRFENGETVYDVTCNQFAQEMVKIIKSGARIIGGCCGTTPEYIKALVEKTKALKPLEIKENDTVCVSSYTHAVHFKKTPIIIGERINPTGKKRFKQALRENDIDYILNEGITQADNGAHILDVNVGLPEIDEVETLKKVIYELQSVTNLPLQIDTSDYDAMEAAMRIYNGKPLVNSVNGKEESMQRIFPLVAKYGGVVIALTLDENGIPETAKGRFDIAKKIIDRAKDFGIDKKNIIIDPLALTISADTSSALVTLEALREITTKLKVKTSLGVSNISFGLPNRSIINSTFFALALASGLGAAIINPMSCEMMSAYYSYMALANLDESCEKYITFSSNITASYSSASPAKQASVADEKKPLTFAIMKGLKEQAASSAAELLKKDKPLTIINEQIIPALDTMGKGFENKTVYLPSLLMSAEAAKTAFDVIKASMPKGNSSDDNFPIIIATVKGDIHDIGKNIVKVLLQNYGFTVYDLGKDVAPETIVAEAKRLDAPLVGLSALMTTTVPAMEETIRLLNKECPNCKTIVGGAVLTKDYAKMIKADFYANDAMEAVRYAEKLHADM